MHTHGEAQDPEREHHDGVETERLAGLLSPHRNDDCAHHDPPARVGAASIRGFIVRFGHIRVGRTEAVGVASRSSGAPPDVASRTAFR